MCHRALRITARAMLAGALLVWTGLAVASADRDPGQVCAVLADRGLSTHGYAPRGDSGRLACQSFRRDIHAGDPVQSSLRFSARGVKGRIDSLHIDLVVHSRKGAQRSHRILLSHIQMLFERVLREPVPPWLAAAVREGRAARGRLGDARIELSRVSSHPPQYDLRLAVSLPP